MDKKTTVYISVNEDQLSVLIDDKLRNIKTLLNDRDLNDRVSRPLGKGGVECLDIILMAFDELRELKNSAEQLLKKEQEELQKEDV